jgi:hypothetical protein
MPQVLNLRTHNPQPNKTKRVLFSEGSVPLFKALLIILLLALLVRVAFARTIADLASIGANVAAPRSKVAAPMAER